MARVAGVKIEKDTKGNPRFARIDLRKHGKELQPFIEKAGTVEEDDFEELWSKAISGDEMVKQVKEHLRQRFKDAGRI